MGYQVGGRCFETKAEAQNHLLSQVTPAIAQTGDLNLLHYSGQVWTYQNQPVNLNLPECSPNADIYAGAVFGAKFIVVLVLAFAFKFFAKAILNLFGTRPIND